MSGAEKQAMRWGGFTIVSGLGASLVAGLLAWVFTTTLENKITFTPVVTAITALTTSMKEYKAEDAIERDRNSVEHKLIVDQLKKMDSRININETLLFRVVSDCRENGKDLKHCKILYGSP